MKHLIFSIYFYNLITQLTQQQQQQNARLLQQQQQQQQQQNPPPVSYAETQRLNISSPLFDTQEWFDLVLPGRQIDLIDFSIPESFIARPDEQPIVNTQLKQILFDYYKLDNSTLLRIQVTGAMMKYVQRVTKYLAQAVMLGQFITVMPFRGMLSLSAMVLPKYITINYPINAAFGFLNDEQYTFRIFFPVRQDVQLNEIELAEGNFYLYRRDPYIMDCLVGEEIIQNAAVLVVGLCVLLYARLVQPASNTNVSITLWLHGFFVWSFPVMNFFMNYLDYAFGALASYVFAPLLSAQGIVNFIISIMLGLLLIGSLFLVYKKINCLVLKSHQTEAFSKQQQQIQSSQNQLQRINASPSSALVKSIHSPTNKPIINLLSATVKPLQVKTIDLENKKVSAYKNANQNQSQKSQTPLQLMRFEILTNDYKQDRPSQRFALIIEMIRYLSMSILIACARQVPLFQIIAVIILNLAFFVYLIICKPFKSKQNNVIAMINEFFLQIILICCLILACYDNADTYGNIIIRMNLGWAIVYVNLIAKFFQAVYFLHTIFLIVMTKLETNKQQDSKAVGFWGKIRNATVLKKARKEDPEQQKEEPKSPLKRNLTIKGVQILEQHRENFMDLNKQVTREKKKNLSALLKQNKT